MDICKTVDGVIIKIWRKARENNNTDECFLLDIYSSDVKG